MGALTGEVLRYTAFAERPDGGNPAGVVLEAGGLNAERMLAIAAAVGYSETAFLSARAGGAAGERHYGVRYWSPVAEVPFCGHATIASAVALAEREGVGRLVFHLASGAEVPVVTSCGADGRVWATLTSVVPEVVEVAPEVVSAALGLLGWRAEELDRSLPPRIAYAGARHLVLAAGSRVRLAALDYDFAGLRQLMLEQDLTTVDLVWREDVTTFHARNPFPVGGVVEDPATGAAAAAFGAYLRQVGAVSAPVRVRVVQGVDMGRPSELLVDIDADQPHIQVTGTAVGLPG